MSDIKSLIKNIDKLKESLNKLIKKKEFNLQDPEVIKASEELDIAISKYNDFLNKKL